MIGTKRFLLGTVMAAALITPASAGTGWYLGLGAGWNSTQDVRATGPGLFLPPGVTGGDFAFKDGFRVTGSLGYKWEGGFRIEGQAGYTDVDLKSFDPDPAGGPIPVTGSNPVWTLGAGLAYDIPLGNRWA